MKKIKDKLCNNKFLIVFLSIFFILLVFLFRKQENLDVQKEIEENNKDIMKTTDYKEPLEYLKKYNYYGTLEPAEDKNDIKLLVPKLKLNKNKSVVGKLVNNSKKTILEYKFIFKNSKSKNMYLLEYKDGNILPNQIAYMDYFINENLNIMDIVPVFHIVLVKEENEIKEYIYDYYLKEVFIHDEKNKERLFNRI